MIKNNVIDMIDEEFLEFEEDKNRRKNIKELISFSSSIINYNEKNMVISDPKLKKKINTTVYIKNFKTNKNQLF
jgi:hypothetical protein